MVLTAIAATASATFAPASIEPHLDASRNAHARRPFRTQERQCLYIDCLLYDTALHWADTPSRSPAQTGPSSKHLFPPRLASQYPTSLTLMTTPTKRPRPLQRHWHRPRASPRPACLPTAPNRQRQRPRPPCELPFFAHPMGRGFEPTDHFANLRSMSPRRSAASLLSSFRLRRTARAAMAR